MPGCRLSGESGRRPGAKKSPKLKAWTRLTKRRQPMKRQRRTFRKYAHVDKMKKADQLRYWLSRPASERLAAVTELTTIEYRRKHNGADPPPLDTTAVRLVPFPEGGHDE